MRMLQAIACRYRRRQIDRWLDLSARRRAQLQAHAQQCEGCHRELDRMLQVHTRLSDARQAYQGVRYTETQPVATEQETLTWWPWTGWKWAPVGFAVACLLGLSLWLQGPEAPGPQVTRVRYRVMSIPAGVRPAMSVKVLPMLRKRARIRLAMPLSNKPKGLAWRYPKRPVRDRSTRQWYRMRPS